MPIVGKSLMWLSLAALVSLGQAAGPKPAGPPPLEIGFERIRAEATFEVEGASDLATSAGAAWIVAASAGRTIRIDVKANATGTPIEAGGRHCGAPADDLGAIWVPLCEPSALVRLDAKTHETVATIPLRLSSPGAIASGVGSVWLLADDGRTLLRFDPEGNLPVAAIAVAQAADLVFDTQALWLAAVGAHQVWKVDAHTNAIEERIDVGKGPRAVAAGEGGVWSLNEEDASISRIDPKTNRVVATVPLGATATGGFIAAGEGSVWVSAPGTPLLRIDPRVNRVVQRFTGDAGGPIAIGHGSLWVVAAPGLVLRVDPGFIEALR